MDADEKLIRHLELIQGVVNRLAGNSFSIKGWSVTLVTALMAVAVDRGNGGFALAGCIPALLFWVLDGYFFWQERLFRKLYDAARLGKLVVANGFFTMDTRPYLLQVPAWLDTAFALEGKNTLLRFHGAIMLTALGGAVFIWVGS